MNIQLTPRLKTIANLVTPGNRVADIGTDHGYISIYLVLNKISNFVVASDVNEGPIKSAMNNIVKYNCNDRIVTRLGSGLETIEPWEVDTAIIAGMGGILIKDLLEAKPEVTNSIKEFVLQPMQAQNLLRRYLVNNGFIIKKDLLVREDNKIYEIIVAARGKQTVENEILYDIGFHIESNPKELAVEFISNKINKEERKIEQLQHADNNATEDIYKDSLVKRKALKAVLDCLR